MDIMKLILGLTFLATGMAMMTKNYAPSRRIGEMFLLMAVFTIIRAIAKYTK
jgi:hypothetical protein